MLPGEGWAAFDLSRPVPEPAPPPETPDAMVRRVVGTVLRSWRRQRGLGQRAAATALGIDQTAWSRLERGRTRIDFDLLARIAELTGSAVWVVLTPEEPFADVPRHAAQARCGERTVGLVVDGPANRLDAPWPPVRRRARPPRRGIS